MGALDSLKDAYFSIEDRYYAFMDYLEEKVHIPVYNAFVNPIEDSGIPSFPFALLLFFILLGAGFYAYMAYFAASSTSVQISVLGANNEALFGVTVTLLVDGEEFNVSTSDENGVALFDGVPVGKTATVKIEREGFEPFAKSFSTTSGPFETVASLQSAAIIEPPSKEEKVSVKVLDENGVPLGGVSISYFDSISGENKHATTDSDGVASLFASDSKSELSMMLSKLNFQDASSNVIVSSEKFKTIRLSASSTIDGDEGGSKAQTGSVMVYAQDETGKAVDAKISLFRKSSSEELATQRTYSSGKALFSRIVAVGTVVYPVVEPMDSSKYLPTEASADAVAIRKDEILEFRITVKKKELSKDYNISLSVIDSENSKPIEGAIVKLFTLSNVPISTLKTNPLGAVIFQADTDVYATIYKNGYLPAREFSLAAGDSKQIQLMKTVEGNNGDAEITVVDADGSKTEGATVSIFDAEGFFAGVPDGKTREDGTANFTKLDLSNQYLARSSKGSLKGQSVVFMVDYGVPKKIGIQLERAYGQILFSAKDITSNENSTLVGASADAILKGTGEILGSCTMISSSPCSIKVNANSFVYLKVTASGFVSLQTEDLIVDTDGQLNAIVSLIPSYLQNSTKVFFEGIREAGSDSPFNANLSVVGKASYYEAKFTANFPQNSEKSGFYVRAGSSESVSADDDTVAISYYQLKDNAEITKGFKSEPSGDCANDQLSDEDSSKKFVKWVNYEHKNLFGSQSYIVKFFVKQTAVAKSSVSLNYRAYSSKNKVFGRDPADDDLGASESISGKDSCYADTRFSKFEVSDGKLKCNDKACISLLFSKEAQNSKLSSGFSADLGEVFDTNVELRGLSEFSDSPYLKLSSEDEIGFAEYSIGNFSGSADDGNSISLQLSSVSNGDKLSGSAKSTGTIPSSASKVSLEFGDVNGPILSTSSFVSITGKGDILISALPSETQANEEFDLTVSLKNAEDDSPLTDASVSIEEGTGSVFDGSVLESVVGDGSRDNGEDGLYKFRKLHPFNTGTILVKAKREGFREAETEVQVTLDEFLQVSASSLYLSCYGSSLDLDNLLDSKISVLATSPCASLSGDGITQTSDGAYSISMNAKRSVSIYVLPTKQSNDCGLSFSSTLPSGLSNSITTSLQVSCSSLPVSCLVDSDCSSGYKCDLETSLCELIDLSENLTILPDAITLQLDKSLMASASFSLSQLSGKVTACEIKSSEADENENMQNFVTADCSSSSGVLSLFADYSAHPYYSPVYSTPSPTYGATPTPYYNGYPNSNYPSYPGSSGVDPRFCQYNPQDYRCRGIYTEAYSSLSFADSSANKFKQTGTLYLTIEGASTKTVAITVLGSKSSGISGSSNVVYITSSGFNPSSIFVPVGTRVTWINQDDRIHSVVSRGGGSSDFDSGSIKPGKSYSFTFKDSGVFSYYDGYHSQYAGSVTVGDLSGKCVYKNIRYFMRRFVAHIANPLVKWFDVGAQEGAVAATSPNIFVIDRFGGVTASTSGANFQFTNQFTNLPGMPGSYPNNYHENYMYAPATNIYGTGTVPSKVYDTQSILSQSESKLCKADSQTGISCDIPISPFLPVNGVPITLENDLTFTVGGTVSFGIKGETKCLKGYDVSKTGGLLQGVKSGVTDVVSIFGPTSRFKTVVFKLNPACVEYYIDTTGKTGLRFSSLSGINSGIKELNQKVILSPIGYRVDLTLNLKFVIKDTGSELLLLKVPAGTSINSRMFQNEKTKEPFFFVNNIPLSTVTFTQVAVLDAPSDKVIAKYVPSKDKNAILDKVAFYKELALGAGSNTIAFVFKAKSKSLNLLSSNTPTSLSLPTVDTTKDIPYAPFDIIGNVGKDAFVSTNNDVQLALQCSGNNFCTATELKEAQDALKRVTETVYTETYADLETLDYVGFGDYASARFADALVDTARDYMADEAQYQLCQGAQNFQDLCRDLSNPSGENYNCYQGEPCDNSVSYTDFSSIWSEELKRSLCDTNIANMLIGAGQIQNWDEIKARVVGMLGVQGPRRLQRKYIVDVGDPTLSVVMKSAADNNQPAYSLASYSVMANRQSDLKFESLVTLDSWLSGDGKDEEDKSISSSAPPLSEAVSGLGQLLVQGGDAVQTTGSALSDKLALGTVRDSAETTPVAPYAEVSVQYNYPFLYRQDGYQPADLSANNVKVGFDRFAVPSLATLSKYAIAPDKQTDQYIGVINGIRTQSKQSAFATGASNSIKLVSQEIDFKPVESGDCWSKIVESTDKKEAITKISCPFAAIFVERSSSGNNLRIVSSKNHKTYGEEAIKALLNYLFDETASGEKLKTSATDAKLKSTGKSNANDGKTIFEQTLSDRKTPRVQIIYEQREIPTEQKNWLEKLIGRVMGEDTDSATMQPEKLPMGVVVLLDGEVSEEALTPKKTDVLATPKPDALKAQCEALQKQLSAFTSADGTYYSTLKTQGTIDYEKNSKLIALIPNVFVNKESKAEDSELCAKTSSKEKIEGLKAHTSGTLQVDSGKKLFVTAQIDTSKLSLVQGQIICTDILLASDSGIKEAARATAYANINTKGTGVSGTLQSITVPATQPAEIKFEIPNAEANKRAYVRVFWGNPSGTPALSGVTGRFWLDKREDKEGLTYMPREGLGKICVGNKDVCCKPTTTTSSPSPTATPTTATLTPSSSS